MTVRQGQTLEMQDIGRVPPGTVLHDGYGRRCTVTDSGYVVTSGSSYPLYSIRGWTFESIPEEGTLARYTVEQFKQMAHTVCYGFALQHGVPREPVLAALQQIGARDDNAPIGVGMWVHYSDRHLRDRVMGKRGVVLGMGDPNMWGTYGEYREFDGRKTIGGAPYFSYCMRVMAVDNPDTDVYLREPTEADDAEVARLRGVIWEIGVRAKRANSWCEAYETAVSVLGVTAHSVTDITAQAEEVRTLPPPDLVVKPVDNRQTLTSMTDIRRLPVGAVLEYTGSTDSTRSPDYEPNRNRSWNWMRRVARGGMEGTENFIGPNAGRFGGTVRVLWDGQGDMRIPVYRDLLPHLPVGTMLVERNGGYFYKKMQHNPTGYEWQQCTADGRVQGTLNVANYGFLNRDGTSSWFICSLPDTHQHGVNCEHPTGNPRCDSRISEDPF